MPQEHPKLLTAGWIALMEYGSQIQYWLRQTIVRHKFRTKLNSNLTRICLVRNQDSHKQVARIQIMLLGTILPLNRDRSNKIFRWLMQVQCLDYRLQMHTYRSKLANLSQAQDWYRQWRARFKAHNLWSQAVESRGQRLETTTHNRSLLIAQPQTRQSLSFLSTLSVGKTSYKAVDLAQLHSQALKILRATWIRSSCEPLKSYKNLVIWSNMRSISTNELAVL